MDEKQNPVIVLCAGTIGTKLLEEHYQSAFQAKTAIAISEAPRHDLTAFHGFIRHHLAHETEATLVARSGAFEVGYAYRTN